MLHGLEHRHQTCDCQPDLARPTNHTMAVQCYPALSSQPTPSFCILLLPSTLPSWQTKQHPTGVVKPLVLARSTRFCFTERRQHLCLHSKGVAGVPVTAFPSAVACSGVVLQKRIQALPENTCFLLSMQGWVSAGPFPQQKQ